MQRNHTMELCDKHNVTIATMELRDKNDKNNY